MKETIINSAQNNTTTLPHFWRDTTNTWRTTNTGINKNVLLILTPPEDRILYKPESFDNLNFKDKKKLNYFTEIINDCLISIYNGEVGYVFTKDQLKEVKKILPRVTIKRDIICGCYCCLK